MLLLVALFSLTEARAGYEYGFEDGNLSADGWVLQGATSDDTGISSSAARSGSYGFCFQWSEQSAFLMSPILAVDDIGVDVSFWYKEYYAGYGDEQFQVGYTTDASVTDAAAFTYGVVVTASEDWQEYTQTFPAGTKRIAIKYIYNDAFYLFLDDFSFSTESYNPTNLTVSPAATQATVKWNGAADSYDVRYGLVPANFGTPGWLKYDNGSPETLIGSSSSSTWTWGVMYPGSMVTGSSLTKVSIYEYDYNTEDITINIYQGGDDAPGTLLYTETVTPESNGFHEVTLATPVAITRGENLWITLTETGTYVLVLCETTEPNNQWIDGGDGWYNLGDIASDYAGYGWMIRGYMDAVTDLSSVSWTTVNTSDNTCNLTGLTASTDYVVQVRANYGENSSEWATTFFTTPSATDAPIDLAATNVKATSATLDWVGSQESYNLRYRQISFFENFENVTNNNLPEGWTSIDSDGDGNNWYSVNNIGAEYCHSGTGLVTSASYNGSALTPDNWLITPKVALDGTMSVWLRAQDPSWAAEHFAIYLSTTGTDVSNFTTTLVPETEATGEYVEYTADLSAYAGQQGYIAIRHFSCTDMFRLNIDDFFIGNNSWTTVSGITNPYAMEGLTPETSYQVQVQGILSDGTTEWSELSSFTTDVMPIVVELYDGEDNTDYIETDIAVGTSINVQLAGRTLYKDGSWNTICLPFDVTVANSPLAGATVYELDTETSSLTTSTLTLNFNEVTTIEAGKPYLIKWTSGDNITDPIFYDVTSPEEGYELQEVTVGNGAITFKGTYDPVTFEAGDESILYVGASNKLYYPSAEVTMNAFRAYFQVDDSSLIKQFVLNFGDDDATGINSVEAGNGSETISNVAGQRLNKAQKGVNIVNGKKILK